MNDDNWSKVVLEEVAREVYGDVGSWGQLRPSDRLLADLELGQDGLALCDVALAIERRLGRPIQAVPQVEMTLKAFVSLFDDASR